MKVKKMFKLLTKLVTIFVGTTAVGIFCVIVTYIMLVIFGRLFVFIIRLSV